MQVKSQVELIRALVPMKPWDVFWGSGDMGLETCVASDGEIGGLNSEYLSDARLIPGGLIKDYIALYSHFLLH